MKILLITQLSMVHFAGTEKMFYILAEALVGKGHRIDIINIFVGNKFPQKENWKLPFCDNRFDVTPIIIKKLPSRYSFYMAFRYYAYGEYEYGSEEIGRIIEEKGDYDIIVAEQFFWLSGIKKAIKEKKSKAKLIFWNHGSLTSINNVCSLKDYLRKIIMSKLLKKWIGSADLCLAISEGMLNLIKSYQPKMDVRLVYNPIVTLDKKIISIPLYPTFIYVGRLDDYQKNVSFILSALNKIREMPWRLKVIGDGPDFAYLKDKSEKMGLCSRVEWLGYKENPFEQIEEATCLLMASRYEGCCLALAESIERGLPVIASNCPVGNSEIVIHGHNGYLFKPGNQEEFLQLLKMAIKGDLNTLPRNQMPSTLVKFHKDLVIKKIEDAIESLFADN